MYQQPSWYELQFLRYRVWQTEIGNWVNFCPFTSLLKAQNIRIFKKWKNLLQISSFYTSLPKTTIIQGTVSKIRSKTDIIFCHFWQFFALLPHYWPQKLKFEINVKKKSGDTGHYPEVLGRWCFKGIGKNISRSWLSQCAKCVPNGRVCGALKLPGNIQGQNPWLGPAT